MSKLGDRLEAARGSRTKTAFAAELGVDRATYHRWLHGTTPLPSQLARIARVIGVDEAVLLVDVGLVPDPNAVFTAIASRRDALRVYQNHVTAMAAAIGSSGDSTGLDVVVKTLREGLAPGPEGPCAITVVPAARGRRHRTLFHHQVAVTPVAWLEQGPPAPATLDRVLPDLRRRVDDVLGPLLLPVTREHSPDLVPGHLRGMCDLLLHPVLLEPRPAPPTAARRPGDHDTLVLSVFQGGAPDIAATIATARSRAFSRLEHLARSTTRTGLGAVSNAALNAALPEVLPMALQPRDATETTTVWAVDHVAPLLEHDVLLHRLRGFTGQVVITGLDDHGLDYAGGLIQQQQGPPDHPDHPTWRSLLEHWQDRLVAVVERLRELDRQEGRQDRPRPLIEYVQVPRWVQPVDGVWVDEVDALFDAYRDSAAALVAKLDGPGARR